ncbi:DUF1735 domain-containing protein [Halosquirtibacter laminarini]|uniref:DUF1735 domain-containing protein n=1 Tax=Halosquirtibacter laminarini TaxID=3374600 RepID=A0AC61NG57_9BACT|nr:DUF1735 domain-containing protein [Prolixibacteraceae bacterium]
MMNFKYSAILLLLVLSFGFFSCEKDETLGPEIKVYLNSEIDPVNKSIVNVIVAEKTSTDKEFIEISPRVTMEAPQDIKVFFELNPSLVEQYNKDNETEYKALNATSVSFGDHNYTTIPKGKFKSEMPLSVSIKEFPNEAGTYMLPIQVNRIEGVDAAKLSSNLNTHYIVVKVVVNNIASDGSSLSTTYADRSGWSVRSKVSGYGNVANLLDGVESSYFLARPLNFDVEMSSEMLMDGIVLTPGAYGGSNFTYCPTKTKVYTSLDGENWTYQYFIQYTKPSAFDQLIKIKFVKPVNAKYIRLESEGGNYNYGCLSEINVVEHK